MADAKWSDDTAFPNDASPALTDAAMGLADPDGTPADVKVLWQAILDLFAAAGTALTDLPSASGDMDTDDTVYGEEDGSPVKFTQAQVVTATRIATILLAISAASGNMDSDDVVFGAEDGAVRAFTRLQLLAGIAAASGAPDSDDVLYGLEDGALAGFTRAQLGTAITALDLYALKAFGTTDQVFSNTSGRRFAVEHYDAGAATNTDLRIAIYLNSTDTEPCWISATVFGVVFTFQFGPGGSTATDSIVTRGAAGVVDLTNRARLQPVTGTSASVPARLTAVTTAVGNVGTGEDTLQTYTVPASTLSATGWQVVLEEWGTFANNANAKTVRTKWAGSTVGTLSLPTSVAGGWRARLAVTRTGATTQDINSCIWADGVAPDITTTTGAATLSNTNAIACSGEATDNNDIVAEQATVDWFGVP